MNSRVQTENRRFPLLRAALLMVLFIMLNACSQDSTPQVDGLRVGPWRAVLQLPGGELPFGMSVSARDGKPVVTLVNGDNRVEVTEITVKDNTVAMLMPGFENRIDGRIDEGVITGTLTMVKAGGKLQKIPLVATHGQAWRFFEQAAPTGGESMAGRWAFTFGPADKTSPAVGEFTQQGSRVFGTVMTPTGDHRYLDGELRNGELQLSKFDGGHVFLYRGKLSADGSLQGTF